MFSRQGSHCIHWTKIQPSILWVTYNMCYDILMQCQVPLSTFYKDICTHFVAYRRWEQIIIAISEYSSLSLSAHVGNIATDESDVEVGIMLYINRVTLRLLYHFYGGKYHSLHCLHTTGSYSSSVHI